MKKKSFLLFLVIILFSVFAAASENMDWTVTGELDKEGVYRHDFVNIFDCGIDCYESNVAQEIGYDSIILKKIVMRIAHYGDRSDETWMWLRLFLDGEKVYEDGPKIGRDMTIRTLLNIPEGIEFDTIQLGKKRGKTIRIDWIDYTYDYFDEVSASGSADVADDNEYDIDADLSALSSLISVSDGACAGWSSLCNQGTYTEAQRLSCGEGSVIKELSGKVTEITVSGRSIQVEPVDDGECIDNRNERSDAICSGDYCGTLDGSANVLTCPEGYGMIELYSYGAWSNVYVPLTYSAKCANFNNYAQQQTATCSGEICSKPWFAKIQKIYCPSGYFISEIISMGYSGSTVPIDAKCSSLGKEITLSYTGNVMGWFEGTNNLISTYPDNIIACVDVINPDDDICDYLEVPEAECGVGTRLCADGTCKDDCGNGNNLGCDPNGVDGTCDNTESCDCSDCDDERDNCAAGLVCDIGIEQCTNGPPCIEGTLLCADNICRSDCGGSNLGCDPNGVDGTCDNTESCDCSDCYNQQDNCAAGLVCSEDDSVCISISGCPEGTRLCADGTCKDDCGNGNNLGCDPNGVDGTCDNTESCDCSDCDDERDNCAAGLVCDIGIEQCTNGPPCIEGTLLCADNICRSDCGGSNLGCDPNGVDGTCDNTESCDCSDCYNQQDNCAAGLVCDPIDEICTSSPPCDFSGVEWEDLCANEGQRVRAALFANSGCLDKQVNFEVSENDFGPDDEVTTNPGSSSITLSGSEYIALTVWNAEHSDLTYPSEYSIKAILNDDNSINLESTQDLEVYGEDYECEGCGLSVTIGSGQSCVDSVCWEGDEIKINANYNGKTCSKDSEFYLQVDLEDDDTGECSFQLNTKCSSSGNCDSVELDYDLIEGYQDCYGLDIFGVEARLYGDKEHTNFIEFSDVGGSFEFGSDAYDCEEDIGGLCLSDSEVVGGLDCAVTIPTTGCDNGKKCYTDCGDSCGDAGGQWCSLTGYGDFYGDEEFSDYISGSGCWNDCVLKNCGNAWSVGVWSECSKDGIKKRDVFGYLGESNTPNWDGGGFADAAEYYRYCGDYKPNDMVECIVEAPFPFFSWFNILLSILILISYYFWKERKNCFKN